MSQSLWIHCVLATLLSVSAACGAGIERAGPSSRVLFEPGGYLELSYTYADPNLRGDGGSLGASLPIEGSTGDIFGSFRNLGAAVKGGLTERLSYALIADQPYGVSTSYTKGFYAGTIANLTTINLTGILAYDVLPDIKAYGGVRGQQMKADGAIPFLGGYAIETDTDIGFGYMLGVAYQKPEIALRVALSYYSAIEHQLNAVEYESINSTLNVKTPQQIHLEFQSGISANNLIFGSLRWVDWPQFVIDPTYYPLNMPMVEYEKAWTTYMVGLGHRFNDRLAGALQVAIEPAADVIMTTLGPVDGGILATASLSYDLNGFTVSGGASFGRLGEARNATATSFDDGSVAALSLRLGYHF